MVSPVVKPGTQKVGYTDSSAAFVRLQETRARLRNRFTLRNGVKQLLAENRGKHKRLVDKLENVEQAYEEEMRLSERVSLAGEMFDLKSRIRQVELVITKQEEKLEQYHSQITELEARVARREARAAKYLLRDLLRAPEEVNLRSDKAETVALERHCGYDAW